MRSVLDYDIEVIWSTLEKTVAEVNSGQGDWDNQMKTIQGAITMLFDFPVEEILGRAARSEIPDRALISWLVYEASKMKWLDQQKPAALAEAWEAGPGRDQGGIIPFPGTGTQGT